MPSILRRHYLPHFIPNSLQIVNILQGISGRKNKRKKRKNKRKIKSEEKKALRPLYACFNVVTCKYQRSRKNWRPPDLILCFRCIKEQQEQCAIINPVQNKVVCIPFRFIRDHNETLSQLTRVFWGNSEGYIFAILKYMKLTPFVPALLVELTLE